MGSIGDCFDNSVVESFFGTLQLELLDEHRWDTRQQLALAIFDWIEAWSRYAGDPPPGSGGLGPWVGWRSCRAWSGPQAVMPAA
jgi:hypothetical protein